MITILKKNTIVAQPIAESQEEAYSIFQNRQDFQENINGFQVYINQYAWDAFLNHGLTVYKQTNHEAQGIFLGKYFQDSFGEFVVATEYSEGVGESSHAYVGMSEECLIKISDECRSKKLLMLIWIHTHPNFGVFYSGTDRTCLKTNFYMPFHSGIVVDIIRKETKGFKVAKDDVAEFDNYFIYNSNGKHLTKPYQIKVDLKSADLKKNENPKSPEFPTKQILEEFQLIKKELAAVKDLVSKKTEQPKLQPQVDSVAEHKTFFESEFGEIKQLILRRKDYTDNFQNISQEQSKTNKFLIWFLIGLFSLFTIGVFVLIYFFINSIFKH